MMLTEMQRYFLRAGDFQVSSEGATLTTILGSCVSVILWDKRTRVGGMNHFVLPKAPNGNASCRYGDIAIQTLLRTMLRHGGSLAAMEAYVVGGGSPVRELRSLNSIGAENRDVAMEMLGQHRIPVLMQDTGGYRGRKVCFETTSGKIQVNALSQVRKTDWYEHVSRSFGKCEIALPFPERRESCAGHRMVNGMRDRNEH